MREMCLYSFPYGCWLGFFLAAVELNNKITCAAVIPILPLLYSVKSCLAGFAHFVQHWVALQGHCTSLPEYSNRK